MRGAGRGLCFDVRCFCVIAAFFFLVCTFLSHDPLGVTRASLYRVRCVSLIPSGTNIISSENDALCNVAAATAAVALGVAFGLSEPRRKSAENASFD